VLGSLWVRAGWLTAVLLGALTLVAPVAVTLLRRRPRRSVARAGLVAVLAVACTGTWALPRTPEHQPYRLPDQVDWLQVGQHRLAVHTTRRPRPSGPPVVFVPGGPAVADLVQDSVAMDALFPDRDVYVYDPLGAGASTRLDDPTGYTTQQALLDLQAVVELTGSNSVVLVGHSWGARYVLEYAVTRPDRVAAVVLTSPGPPPVSTMPLPPAQPQTRLDRSDATRLYAAAAMPRNLFTYLAASIDLRAAHAMAGDREMDARFARLYGRTAPALFCDTARGAAIDPTSVGFYAYQAEHSQAAPAVTLEQVRSATVPVLIIRGECDYIGREVATEYDHLLSSAELVDLAGAGHMAYLEQPDAWRRRVDQFLRQ